MKSSVVRQPRFAQLTDIHPHPKAYLVPSMRPSEWSEFYTDVSMAGIRQPIEVSGDGTILDGHHRYRAAKELGMEQVLVVDAPLNGDDAETYMLKAAVLRRQLTDDQRAMVAAQWKQENKQEPQAGPGRGHIVEKTPPPRRGGVLDNHNPTATKATELFKVSRRKVDKASYVQTRAPELAAKVHNGDIALNNAFRQVKGTEERVKIANTVTPEGSYQVIVIDPPWPYTSRQNDPTHEIASQYEPMSIEQLKKLPIPAHSDSILWLWTTNTFLHDAFHLLEAWGFQYHTTLTWAKQGVGLGDWLGGQTEHCLLATKGNYKVFRNNESTFLQADRQKHSEKPDAFYSMVEKLCPGIKADMFARKQREGWYCWGAEANGK